MILDLLCIYVLYLHNYIIKRCMECIAYSGSLIMVYMCKVLVKSYAVCRYVVKVNCNTICV